MADRYSVQFSLAERDATGRELLHAVASDVIGWLPQHLALETTTPPFTVRVGPHEWVEISGDSVGTTEHWTLVYEHPDAEGRPSNWRTEVRLATVGTSVECSIQARLVGAGTAVLPVRADVDRPRLVPVLTEKYEASSHGWPITAEPTMVYSDSVAKFVEGTLFASTRRLPVVLVTPFDRDSSYATDYRQLADRLCGLAHVAVLYGVRTSDRFNEYVGQPLGCYNGAVRIYWPGLSKNEVDTFSHNLWLGWRISETPRLRRFDRYLLHVLAPLVTRSLADGTVWREAVIACERERLGTLRDQLLRAARDDDSLALDELLAEESRKVQLANRAREDAEYRTLEVEEKLAQADDQIDQIRSTLRALLLSRSEAHTPAIELPTPTSVLEAVLFARERSDYLVFTDEAIKSADESHFRRYDDVLNALEEINRVAAARAAKTLNDSVFKQFKSVGIDYVGSISDITLGQYGDAYTVRYGGNDLVMEEHVRFGTAGDQQRTLRIYMCWDPVMQKYIIGHVGKHLPNTLS
jgi:hypothetical protein